jgi:probable HAF family extracellular repeat protein
MRSPIKSLQLHVLCALSQWHKRKAAAPLELLLVAAFTNVAQAQATFHGLGNLGDGSPGWPSQAYGISADGSTAVGYSDSYNPSGVQAFRWTAASGMQGLGDLPGSNHVSYAYGANADGSVVVGFGSPQQGSEAFRWTSSTGLQGLGDLPGGGFESIASAASADGSVVVGYGNASGNFEAFRWTSDSGMQGLGDLPGGAIQSGANGISADGAVVVGTGASAAGSEAFRWTQATGLVGLGFLLGDTTSSGGAISADGSTIVGTSGKPGICDESGCAPDDHAEAFRWTAGGMQGLGFLAPGTYSGALAVSGDGSVIVGGAYGDFDGDLSLEFKPFIWDAVHGMRDLQQLLVKDYGINLTGWSSMSVTGISADGRAIVGNGTNPAGFAEGWIATLPTSSGDFNDDGFVNGADLETWTAGFSASTGATHKQGDANGDADVDGGDFLVWQRQFTGGPGFVASSPAIPEPSGFGLYLTCFAPLVRRRPS